MDYFESSTLNYLMISLIISFAINLLFFIIAILNKTDKVTDLSYSLTFLTNGNEVGEYHFEIRENRHAKE